MHHHQQHQQPIPDSERHRKRMEKKDDKKAAEWYQLLFFVIAFSVPLCFTYNAYKVKGTIGKWGLYWLVFSILLAADTYIKKFLYRKIGYWVIKIIVLGIILGLSMKHIGVNGERLARTLQVPGQFVPVSEGMQRGIAQLAFEEVVPLNIVLEFEFKEMHSNLNTACENFVLTELDLLQSLKAEKVDMIISEQLNFCGTGLPHLLAIPTYIQLQSCPIQEHVASMLGLPNPSSYIPAIIGSSLTDRMSLAERFFNLRLHFAGYYTFTHNSIDPLTQIFRRNFGADFPDLRDIVKDSPLVLVNVDEVVDFPRPVFSNFVYIGGLGMEADNKKQELPEPIKSEMAKGAKGVAFFSMGSIMQSTDMTEDFRRNIFRAFAQHPDYHFIVKIEKADNFSTKLAQQLDNVFICSWMPQAEMLAHPRLKLFITHGGYNSLMEAAWAGVSHISMGFFADQSEAIGEVLGNPKYAKNAKRTQKLVLNKPFTAEERLQRSIRFLELSGGKLPELLSESRNMSTIAIDVHRLLQVTHLYAPLSLEKLMEMLEYEPESGISLFKITYETFPGNGCFWGFIQLEDRQNVSKGFRLINKKFPRLNEYSIQAGKMH